MFHLNNDARRFEAEAIGRGHDVNTAVCPRGRYSRFIAHCAEQAGNELFHLVGIQAIHAILDEFDSA